MERASASDGPLGPDGHRAHRLARRTGEAHFHLGVRQARQLVRLGDRGLERAGLAHLEVVGVAIVVAHVRGRQARERVAGQRRRLLHALFTTIDGALAGLLVGDGLLPDERFVALGALGPALLFAVTERRIGLDGRRRLVLERARRVGVVVDLRVGLDARGSVVEGARLVVVDLEEHAGLDARIELGSVELRKTGRLVVVDRAIRAVRIAPARIGARHVRSMPHVSPAASRRRPRGLRGEHSCRHSVRLARCAPFPPRDAPAPVRGLRGEHSCRHSPRLSPRRCITSCRSSQTGFFISGLRSR